jgi:hypothetical protein
MLQKEYRVEVLENKLLNRIFGLQREEQRAGWRDL